MLNRILELHTQRNLDSRAAWECFRAHRDRVTDLLLTAAGPDQPHLCVLGAGNCNDLDLRELLTRYSQIRLVDLDAAALESGLTRQGLSASSHLLRHGGVDITGVADHFAQWRPECPVADEHIDECLADLHSAQVDLPDASFQVVASVCILSQLIDTINQTLGERHPRFVEVMSALRLRHFHLLLQLTKPGGTAILITDIVSSITCPQLNDALNPQLRHIVLTAIGTRNFFTGLNPLVLRRLVETEPSLAPLVSAVTLMDPWLWDLGPRRYAVCAVHMSRQ